MQRLNYRGGESKKHTAVYVSDTPVTFKQSQVIKSKWQWKAREML